MATGLVFVVGVALSALGLVGCAGAPAAPDSGPRRDRIVFVSDGGADDAGSECVVPVDCGYKYYLPGGCTPNGCPKWACVSGRCAIDYPE